MRTILITSAENDDEPPGCNPQHTPLPDDRDVAAQMLQDYLVEIKTPQGHPAKDIAGDMVSGMAGELRALEKRSPRVVARLAERLGDFTASLTDDRLAALYAAVQQWGLDNQAVWRFAPRLGLALDSVSGETDPSVRREALQTGLTDSFPHNVAQVFIQMLLYPTPRLKAKQIRVVSLLIRRTSKLWQTSWDSIAVNRLAVQTWRRVRPAVDSIAAMAPGSEADQQLRELEGLLLALAGEEEYSSWVYRPDSSSLEAAPPPQQNRGGGERARVAVHFGGVTYYPGRSSNGVDWQDIGMPRLNSSSTGWIGTPTLSRDRPARWIGTITLDDVVNRKITGRVVDRSGNPVVGLEIKNLLQVRRGTGLGDQRSE